MVFFYYMRKKIKCSDNFVQSDNANFIELIENEIQHDLTLNLEFNEVDDHFIITGILPFKPISNLSLLSLINKEKTLKEKNIFTNSLYWDRVLFNQNIVELTRVEEVYISESAYPHESTVNKIYIYASKRNMHYKNDNLQFDDYFDVQRDPFDYGINEFLYKDFEARKEDIGEKFFVYDFAMNNIQSESFNPIREKLKELISEEDFMFLSENSENLYHLSFFFNWEVKPQDRLRHKDIFKLEGKLSEKESFFESFDVDSVKTIFSDYDYNYKYHEKIPLKVKRPSSSKEFLNSNAIAVLDEMFTRLSFHEFLKFGIYFRLLNGRSFILPFFLY